MDRHFECKGWPFEWDSEKEAKNIRAHGISFERAAIFFRDGESVIEPDYRHSLAEERWVAIGVGSDGQLFSICVTWRETETGKTSYRIISAYKISGKNVSQHRRRLLQRKIETSHAGVEAVTPAFNHRTLCKSE